MIEHLRRRGVDDHVTAPYTTHPGHKEKPFTEFRGVGLKRLWRASIQSHPGLITINHHPITRFWRMIDKGHTRELSTRVYIRLRTRDIVYRRIKQGCKPKLAGVGCKLLGKLCRGRERFAGHLTSPRISTMNDTMNHLYCRAPTDPAANVQ